MNELKNLKIFSWISEDIVIKLLQNCKIEQFTEWSTIFKEWESSNWKWYIIKSWDVEIQIEWKNIAQLYQGDIFWEIALLNEEERTATVIAKSNLELIVLNLDDLIEMINNDENTINKKILNRIEENLDHIYHSEIQSN